MRSDEQATVDQLLLQREYSVVASLSGDDEFYAAISRPTGDSDNGNQYWLQVKDGTTRYEACIVGDWEFDSTLHALQRIDSDSAGRLRDLGDSPQLAEASTRHVAGTWLTPTEKLETLMRVTLAPAVGNKGSAWPFAFGLHTASQQLLVQIETSNADGFVERFRFDVLRDSAHAPTTSLPPIPTVQLSKKAVACLLEVAVSGAGCPEFGLLRHPRRDWIIGFPDLAGRPTVDELDFAVRSIEERLDRRVAEEAVSNGGLMVLRSILRFRTVEQLHRMGKEQLLAHVLASHLGRTIQQQVEHGAALEFMFAGERVLGGDESPQSVPNALAVLLFPASILIPEGAESDATPGTPPTSRPQNLADAVRRSGKSE